MINLIKKDLILSKKMNIFGIIYALFVAAMGASQPDSIVSNLIYILVIIMLVFIFVIYTNGYDNYKSEMLFNSLQIDRRNIVRSKYLTLIIFTVSACGIVFLLSKSMYLFGFTELDNSLSIQIAILIVSIVLIFYSIYYPYYFKVGESIRSFNSVLWILTMIGPGALTKILKTSWGNEILTKLAAIDFNTINLYILALSLIMYYISLQISKGIYKRREF